VVAECTDRRAIELLNFILMVRLLNRILSKRIEFIQILEYEEIDFKVEVLEDTDFEDIVKNEDSDGEDQASESEYYEVEYLEDEIDIKGK
jgi:hypothetical protein